MIPPLKFFELYMAITLHFKGGSYDFFKYGGRTRVTEDSLLKRKDKIFFEKWAARCTDDNEAVGFLVSNQMNGNTYIRGLDWKCYNAWVAYRDSLFYVYKSDVEKYTGPNKTDPIQQCYAGDTSPYNYLVITNAATNGWLFDHLDKTYGDDIQWDELKTKLLTYSPFVIYYYELTDEKLRTLRNDVTKRVI